MKTVTWKYKGEADVVFGEVHISPLPKIVLYTTIGLVITLCTLGFIFRDSIYDLLVNPQIMLSGVVSTDNGYMLEIPYQSNFDPEIYIDKINTREYESFINPDIKSYSYNIDGVVDVNTLGEYQITYNSHNRVKSQHTILTVYVKDTDSPIITLQNPKTHENLKTNTDGTYKSFIVLRGEGDNKYLGTNDFSVESFIGTITDNCSSVENINITYPDKPVFGNKEVEYVELKYIATDEAGLSSEAVLNLIVTDDISNIDVADIDNILDDDNIQDKIDQIAQLTQDKKDRENGNNDKKNTGTGTPNSEGNYHGVYDDPDAEWNDPDDNGHQTSTIKKPQIVANSFTWSVSSEGSILDAAFWIKAQNNITYYNFDGVQAYPTSGPGMTFQIDGPGTYTIHWEAANGLSCDQSVTITE